MFQATSEIRKRPLEPVSEIPSELQEDLSTLVKQRVWSLFNDSSHDKESRGQIMFAIRDEATESLKGKYPHLDK